MQIKDAIIEEIEERIAGDVPEFEIVNVGIVTRVGDGVVILSGLTSGKMGEVVEFENGSKGLILNLKKDGCGVVVFGDFEEIKEGTQVRGTGEILGIGVTDAFLGRVINPLGEPIDGEGGIKHKSADFKKMPIEKIAAGIIDREGVDTPLQTGIKVID